MWLIMLPCTFCSLPNKSSNTPCLCKDPSSEWAAIKWGEPPAVEGVERLVLHPAPVKAHLLFPCCSISIDYSSLCSNQLILISPC